MSEQPALEKRYMVYVDAPEEPGANKLTVTFYPTSLAHERGTGGNQKRVPQFIVTVRQVAERMVFDWKGTSDEPDASREEMEAEVAARMKDREAWIERVASLVSQVEVWARELEWSTRRVEKKLEDSRIGKHRVPALLMQQETCRALLEPIGRSSSDVEGRVDLYLMPAYDDIASFFYYDNRWNLYYNSLQPAKAAIPVSKAEAMPLSKETLAKVLAEMLKNAA